MWMYNKRSMVVVYRFVCGSDCAKNGHSLRHCYLFLPMEGWFINDCFSGQYGRKLYCIS